MRKEHCWVSSSSPPRHHNASVRQPQPWGSCAVKAQAALSGQPQGTQASIVVWLAVTPTCLPPRQSDAREPCAAVNLPLVPHSFPLSPIRPPFVPLHLSVETTRESKLCRSHLLGCRMVLLFRKGFLGQKPTASE